PAVSPGRSQSSAAAAGTHFFVPGRTGLNEKRPDFSGRFIFSGTALSNKKSRPSDAPRAADNHAENRLFQGSTRPDGAAQTYVQTACTYVPAAQTYVQTACTYVPAAQTYVQAART